MKEIHGNIDIEIPLLEWWIGKSYSKSKFRFYFLYFSKPTRWRENWRSISGFYLRQFGYYFRFAVWRQDGLYFEPVDPKQKESLAEAK